MAKEKRYDEMAWANIRTIKSNKDAEYVKDVLKARRDFLDLRSRHELGIRKIYIDAADRVADRLRNLPPTTGKLTRNHLTALEKELRKEADKITKSTEALIKTGIEKAVSLGATPVDNQLIRAIQQAGVKAVDIAKLQKGFADINSSAVEALWARTKNGLRISRRIWNHSQEAKEAMMNLIQTGVAAGRDAVGVARDLERYVRNGAKTLAGDYPNMMARMGKRVPKDLSYEALRLARTEYSNAFFEGVYSRGRINPSYLGVRWLLSDAHVVPDVCDELANADLYKMGKGVYAFGEEPPIPHPNCLCYIIPYLEDTDKFVDQLIEWQKNPGKDKKLEEWYNNVYKKVFDIPIIGKATAQTIVNEDLTIDKWRYAVNKLAVKDDDKFQKAVENIKSKFKAAYNIELEFNRRFLDGLQDDTHQRKAVTELYHALERMPKEAISNNSALKKIILGENIGAWGDYSYLNSTVRIGYDAFISLPELNTKRISHAHETLIHEIGHAVHYANESHFRKWVNEMWDLHPIRKQNIWDYYKTFTGEIKDMQGITLNGTTDPLEDFADSWRILYADSSKKRNEYMRELQYNNGKWEYTGPVVKRHALLKELIEQKGWKVPE